MLYFICILNFLRGRNLEIRTHIQFSTKYTCKLVHKSFQSLSLNLLLFLAIKRTNTINCQNGYGLWGLLRGLELREIGNFRGLRV